MAAAMAAAADRFDLDGPDHAALDAAAARAESDPCISSWVDSAAGALRDALGERSPRNEAIAAITDQLAEDGSDQPRFLPMLAFARAMPSCVDFMRSGGIADSVIDATLADVGRTSRKNRAWFGKPGLDPELAAWLTRHLHGAIYQLGRLQFERTSLGEVAAAAIMRTGLRARVGEPLLSIHIPADLGPITAAACDASIALARDFFASHFPDERVRYAACGSWLLDPQLAEYLAPSSNILAFQRRFAITVHAGDAATDVSVRRFVFGEARTPLVDQPSVTSLERAVHEHVSTGRHFQVGSGWFRWGPLTEHECLVCVA